MACRLTRRGLALGRTSPQWSSFQPNFISLTNQRNRDEHYARFGRDGRSMGIPRLPRVQVKSISVLHETAHIMVAGRNKCSGFACNQFLLIHKPSRHCIFVDACDDWPDDWATFVKSSGLTPTHVFLTHCHIDNIVNLNALLTVMRHHLGVHLGIMWNPAEQVWVEAFPRACERYGRREELQQRLPMTRLNQHSFYTHAHGLLQREAAAAASASPGAASPPEPLVRRQDILLSSATSRSASFYEMGDHSTLHYVCTPGHSPGHMMLSLPREKLLFTGDVLLYNHIGRVDLPWATGEQLAESLLALEDFPDHTVLFPGHGRLTTLGRERRENRALRALYERRELGQQEVSVGFNAGYL